MTLFFVFLKITIRDEPALYIKYKNNKATYSGGSAVFCTFENLNNNLLTNLLI